MRIQILDSDGQYLYISVLASYFPGAKNSLFVPRFTCEDGVGHIKVKETDLLGRGAGGVVCRATHKPTGLRRGWRVWRSCRFPAFTVRYGK